MNEKTRIIRFRNANGVKFRAVPVDGGYQLQTRSFFLWFNETAEQVVSEYITFGVRRISIERVPLRVSTADFKRMAENGAIILDANSPKSLKGAI